MIKTYFKTAFRSLYQNMVPSVINIGGLAVALSVVILIFLWVQHEYAYDSDIRGADQLFLLTEIDNNSGEYNDTAPYVAYQAIRSEVPEVEQIAVASPGTYMDLVITKDEAHFLERDVLFVDSNWISLFDYRLVSGSFDRLRTDLNVIAISASKAKLYFGTTPAVGEAIIIDGVPTTVVAVFADVPTNATFSQGVLMPHKDLLKRTSLQHLTNDWGGYIFHLFVKLHPSANPNAVATKITPIFDKNQTYHKAGERSHQLIPLSDIHLGGFGFDGLPQGNKQTIATFSALAFLLLLTACVNFVNLSVARINTRHKEIGIRKVTGAAKWQLFGQVMTETGVTVAITAVLTVLLVVGLLPHFNRYFETSLTFSLTDTDTLLLLAATFAAVLLLTGIYPAWLTGKSDPLNLFRGKALGHTDNKRFREALLVGQMVLAVTMVVAVFIIHGQFRYIQQATEAYQMDHVFSFRKPVNTDEVIRLGSPEMADYLRRINTLKAELLRNSAIKAVTRVNGVSLIDNPTKRQITYEWTGYPKEEKRQEAVVLWVDPDYIQLADIQLLAGHWFDDPDESEHHDIVINETAVKAFGLKEPVVGTTFDMMSSYRGTVIGVVKDFHHASLHQPIEPVVFELSPAAMGGEFMVEAQGGRITDALAATEAAWKQQYPNKPFEYTFLDEEFDKLYKNDQKALTFSLVFAVLSLVISTLGILAMAMFVTRQRVKEIGIRKVLGATVAGVVGVLSKDLVKLVLIAIVIASPIAWWVMNNWLQDFAYHIAIQWWMFAAAGLVAVVITLLTVSWQVMRAAVANPVDSLRDE